MKITTKLKPLYDDLIEIGIVAFLVENEFIRLCETLNVTEHYTAAHNSASVANDEWAWLNSIAMSYEDLLLVLLEKLYADNNIDFPAIVCSIVEAYIPHSHFIPSINDLVRDLLLLGAKPIDLNKIKFAWAKEDEKVYKKVQVLKSLLISRATGGVGDEHTYQTIRTSLMNDQDVVKYTPEYVLHNETVYDFWQFIKHALPSYEARRVFIRQSLEDLLNIALSTKQPAPHHELIPKISTSIDEQYITDAWRKALNRLKDDPQGAITSARSLIEIVCKYILHLQNVEYDDSADLPKLYKLTAAQLKLSPDQHTEQLFKQILGGCQTVVEGLGGLRNKLGDAHGMSTKKVKPSDRHAALAVNLSGSMCTFLLQTYIARNTIQ